MDPLSPVIKAGDIEAIRTHLQLDPSAAVRILHLAAQHQQFEIVRLALEHGAPINAKSNGQSTALHLMLLFGQALNMELLEFLLSQGADVNASDKKGNTPLHFVFAWRRDVLPALDLLLRHGADVNKVGGQGRTPLDYAVTMLGSPWNHLPRFELLLRHGANVNPVRSGEHHLGPPLCGVAANGNAAIARLLIEAGADVNAPSRWGTPLHYAARNGHPQIVALLLAAGADPRAVDSDGHTPLDLTEPYEETLAHFETLIGAQ